MLYVNKLDLKFYLFAVMTPLLIILCFPSNPRCFWKTCISIDSSFYHQIIDPDILEIGNSEYYAFVTVIVEGVPRRNAFSRCANGCPLFPNNSVKVAKNKIKVCEGDSIFVYNDQFTIDKIRKERWPK